MGRMYIEGFKEAGADMELALRAHLRGNLFPPQPEYMYEPCLAAIEAANEEDYDREIDMPEGVLYKHLRTAPASAIIEQFRLEGFLDWEEDDDE